MPGVEIGRPAARRKHARDRHARRENRGLGVLGEGQAILGPLETEAAEGLAERVIGFREGVAGDRLGLGERAAHADALRALAGEEERDH